MWNEWYLWSVVKKRVSNGKTNNCDKNKCGINEKCEIDNGKKIWLSKNPFKPNKLKKSINEGDKCEKNKCGKN
jgi:hypothetical protein